MQHAAQRPATRPWMRPIYFALGSVFLVIGFVGVALPLIPTTGPMLLAAFFFARSSDRFHAWLMNHPRFGPLIADFRAGRGIPAATKALALVAMVLAFGVGILFVTTHWAARLVVGLIAVAAIGYVARLPISR